MLQLWEPGESVFTEKDLNIQNAQCPQDPADEKVIQSTKGSFYSVVRVVHNVVQKVTSFMGRGTTSELVKRINYLEGKLQEMKNYSDSLLEEVDRNRTPTNDKELEPLQQLMFQLLNEKKRTCCLKLLIEEEHRLQSSLESSIYQIKGDFEVHEILQHRCYSLQRENHELLESAQKIMGNVRAAVAVLGCSQSCKCLSHGVQGDITIKISGKNKRNFKFDEVIPAGVHDEHLMPICNPFVQSLMDGKWKCLSLMCSV